MSATRFLVDQFADGDMVDVIGKSKGRGFAGTIKRHKFNRGPESHGSMNVRAPGSIGASAYPSRVIKGTRSSGHMGDERVTIKGLTVARVDAENNLLMIRGAVPGANGSVVVVQKVEDRRKKMKMNGGTMSSSFNHSDSSSVNGVIMPTVKVRNLKNEEVGEVELSDAVFRRAVE